MIYAPEMVINHPSRAKLSEVLSKKRRVLGGRYNRALKHESTAVIMKTLASETVNEMRWLKNEQANPGKNRKVLAVPVAIFLTNAYELARLSIGLKPQRQ